MASNTQILTVSVPIAFVKFIEDAELSPSGVFQEALAEKKHLWDIVNNEKKKLEENILRMQKLLTEYTTYLEKKNLSEEFYIWRGEFKSQDRNDAIL